MITFCPDIRRNLQGRQTIVTDLGDEIDVVSLIAAIWKKDQQIVLQGLQEALGFRPHVGEFVQ